MAENRMHRQVESSSTANSFPRTMLRYHWHIPVLLSAALYFKCQLSYWLYDRITRDNIRICSMDSLPTWVQSYLYLLLGAYGGGFMLKIMKLLHMLFTDNNIGAQGFMAAVLFYSMSSICLEISPYLNQSYTGYICSHGNSHHQSTIFMWIECLVNTPLFFYLFIIYDGTKKNLTWQDYQILFLSMVFVVCMFIMNITGTGSTVTHISTFLAFASVSYALSSLYKRAKVGYEHVKSYNLSTLSPSQLILCNISQARYYHTIYLCISYLILLLINMISYPNPYTYFILSRYYTLFFRIIPMMYLLSTDFFHSSSNTAIRVKQSQEAQIQQRQHLRYIFHEIRVPMQSISIAIELIGNELKRIPGYHEMCEEIMDMMSEQLHFLAHTLNDVLAMQKVEEGKLILSSETFVISDHINEILVKIQSLLLLKDITIKINIDPSVPSIVIGDKYRIEHVLTNLIENGIRTSPKNTVINVSVFYNRHHDGHITYIIEDQGSILSKRAVEIMFDKYTQINDKADSSQGSSRVALAICKEIVSMYGGELGYIPGCKRAESHHHNPQHQDHTLQHIQPSDMMIKGNEYYFSFPLAPGQPQRHHMDNDNVILRTSSMESQSSYQSSIGGMNDRLHVATGWPPLPSTSSASSSYNFTTLIVDDSVVNRRMLTKLLKGLGLKVDVACDGQEFVDIINSKTPLTYYDVIFCDSNMPIMNGPDAVKVVRNLGYYNMIVGLTGDASQESFEVFLAAGVDQVLSKPIDSSKLHKIFQEIRTHKQHVGR